MSFSGSVPFLGNEIQVPPGCIVMWDGPLQDIPSGWLYCDGNNGTPDLRNKYLKSVFDSSTNPGATGGQASYTMSENQMPVHNHGASGTSTDGDHTHRLEAWDTQSGDDDFNVNLPSEINDPDTPPIYVNDAGNHSHNLNINSTGSDNPINNEPRYKTVVYIQKQ